ncbi:hypothetical protein [Pseudomonas phage UF_RH7]|nr:hypothetical protein [Pseudomonas phage UF_RH7]
MIVQKHICDVRPGDVVRHAGADRTVGNADLKSGFMGVTLFGDSYRLGRQLVDVVVIESAMPNAAGAQS